MDNQRPYYLLLADIQGSAAMSGRRNTSLMEQLLPQLARQNQKHHADLIYPLEVNYGDEFAGLFSSPRALYQIVCDIRDALHGVAEFRFVTAFGRIGYAGGTIREMGGPVFEEAARALSRQKKQRQFSDWQISDMPTNLALSAMTNAAAALIDDMTPYQHIVYMFQKAGLKGTEIAKKLGKDPRSVSNAKIASHAKTVHQLEKAINSLLCAADSPVDSGAKTQEVA